jgi:adenosylhomocysteine nucleosidase
VYQDIDASPICAYGLTPFEAPELFIQIDPTSEVSCFSTDYFYDHRQMGKYSESYLNMIRSSSVFDMELYAMAKVCRKHGVALSAYKWVSDDGDFAHWLENCKMSLERFMDSFEIRP